MGSSLVLTYLHAETWKIGARTVSIDTTFFSANRACISVMRPPYVETVTPQFAKFSSPTRITIKGKRFGAAAADLSSVFLGDFECTSVVWVSASEVHCTTPVLSRRQLEALGFSGDSEGHFVMSQQSQHARGRVFESGHCSSHNDSFGLVISAVCFVPRCGLCCLTCTKTHTGQSHPRVLFNGSEMKRHRNAMQPVHMRAVALTVTDNNRLVLASPLVPDDRLEHALGIIKALVKSQIDNDQPVLAAVFCDSVAKFAKG